MNKFIVIVGVVFVLFLFGCTENQENNVGGEGKKAECPFECCNDSDVYLGKVCGQGKICIQNRCTEETDKEDDVKVENEPDTTESVSSTGDKDLDDYLTNMIEIERTRVNLTDEYLSSLNELKEGALDPSVFCEQFVKAKEAHETNFSDFNSLSVFETEDVFVEEVFSWVIDVRGRDEANILKEFGFAETYCSEPSELNKSKLGKYAGFYNTTYINKLETIFDYYKLKKQSLEWAGIGDSVVKDGFEIRLVSVTPNYINPVSSEVSQKPESVTGEEWSEIKKY